MFTGCHCLYNNLLAFYLEESFLRIKPSEHTTFLLRWPYFACYIPHHEKSYDGMTPLPSATFRVFIMTYKK